STLSLHDALPISGALWHHLGPLDARVVDVLVQTTLVEAWIADRGRGVRGGVDVVRDIHTPVLEHVEPVPVVVLTRLPRVVARDEVTRIRPRDVHPPRDGRAVEVVPPEAAPPAPVRLPAEVAAVGAHRRLGPRG